MATSKTTHVHTLIVGGGITGLSLAYALEQQGMRDYVLLEAQDHVGGLCATTEQNGYQFDFGGHLLHLHTRQGKAFVKQLLGKNLKQHTRSAFIYTNGMHVPYPFQQNLWALHPELRALCLAGLKRIEHAKAEPENLAQWGLNAFGHGIYEAFFRPYNEKLWGRPLTELTCEWCAPFVPAPPQQAIQHSAHQRPTGKLGYNATFYYPKQGGIGALTQALAKNLSHVKLNEPVLHVDLKQKRAYTAKQTIYFEYLANTMSLPNFVGLLENASALKRAAALLQAQAVTVYHLAVAHPLPHFSWIYFPDSAQPFYRMGLQSGFSSDAVPDKATALVYIELPGTVEQTPASEKRIWLGLHQKGLVPYEDTKLFSTWQYIPHAYVLFNKQRAQAVPFLLSELAKQHVYCAGRYGKWEYSFMERSMLETQLLAQQLAKLV